MQDNKKNKIKGDKTELLKEMGEYTVETINIIENCLENDEKEIFNKELNNSNIINIYTAPEERCRIAWITMTNILNKHFSDIESCGKHQMLITTFNSRSAEFDVFLKKFGLKKN